MDWDNRSDVSGPEATFRLSGISVTSTAQDFYVRMDRKPASNLVGEGFRSTARAFPPGVRLAGRNPSAGIRVTVVHFSTPEARSGRFEPRGSNKPVPPVCMRAPVDTPGRISKRRTSARRWAACQAASVSQASADYCEIGICHFDGYCTILEFTVSDL